MKKINRDSKEYDRFLAVYLNTKHGRAFTYHVLSQLIKEFEIDYKGKIREALLDDENPLVIDFEE